MKLSDLTNSDFRFLVKNIGLVQLTIHILDSGLLTHVQTSGSVLYSTHMVA